MRCWTGFYRPEDAPPTDVQKRLFGEPPAPETDVRAAARKVARSLARNAYRRPPSEAELDVLLGVFDLGAKQARLSGVAAPDAQSDPRFPAVPVHHAGREAEAGRQIVPLDDYQLASRLSYLLWATMPDAELMALADRGKLHEPAILKAQVKRLLEDPRSRALFDGFGAQWLGLGRLEGKTFDTPNSPR